MVLTSVKTESTQEQMNKSTCNCSNSVELKIHSLHSVNLQTCWIGLLQCGW